MRSGQRQGRSVDAHLSHLSSLSLSAYFSLLLENHAQSIHPPLSSCHLPHYTDNLYPTKLISTFHPQLLHHAHHLVPPLTSPHRLIFPSWCNVSSLLYTFITLMRSSIIQSADLQNPCILSLIAKFMSGIFLTSMFRLFPDW